jgi:hypothetical protein
MGQEFKNVIEKQEKEVNYNLINSQIDLYRN